MKARQFLVAASCVLVFLAGYAPGPAPGSEEIPEIVSLDGWDEAMTALRRSHWVLRGYYPENRKDSAGRTVGDDLDQYVLPENIVAHLEALRIQAQAQRDAGDQKGLEKTIGEARVILDGQMKQVFAVGSYWQALTLIELQRAAISPFAANATEADRAALAAFAGQIDQRLRESRASLLGSTDEGAMTKSLASMHSVVVDNAIHYGKQRGKWIAEQVKYDSDPNAAELARTAACGAPMRAEGESARARIKGGPDLEPFYPEDAKQEMFEGVVTVRADVDAQGCVQKVRISRTSGDPRLDAAALDWALQASMVPALIDGTPQASQLSFNVRFTLN